MNEFVANAYSAKRGRQVCITVTLLSPKFLGESVFLVRHSSIEDLVAIEMRLLQNELSLIENETF